MLKCYLQWNLLWAEKLLLHVCVRPFGHWRHCVQQKHLYNRNSLAIHIKDYGSTTTNYRSVIVALKFDNLRGSWWFCHGTGGRWISSTAHLQIRSHKVIPCWSHKRIHSHTHWLSCYKICIYIAESISILFSLFLLCLHSIFFLV